MCASISPPVVQIDTLQRFVVTPNVIGLGEPVVAITSPSGARVKPRIIPNHPDGKLAATAFFVDYAPTELGDYLITVSYSGQALPYRVRCVQQPPANRVRAYGPGLSGGTCGRQTDFIIDTRQAGPGGLGVTVEGPCEAAIRCRDNGDGTCSVAYLATVEGNYYVNIAFNDEPIPGSPFVARIERDPISLIRTTGHGILPDKGMMTS